MRVQNQADAEHIMSVQEAELDMTWCPFINAKCKESCLLRRPGRIVTPVPRVKAETPPKHRHVFGPYCSHPFVEGDGSITVLVEH